MSASPTETRPLAVVTGATGGIGRACVVDLARDHDVLALGRDAGRLAELAGLPHVTVRAADLTDVAALPAVVADLDRVDVLVHSAAVAGRTTVEAASVADWRAQLELNVVVPAELTRLLLPALRAARGKVVFLNSGSGLTAHAGDAVYAASKFALRALADSLRQEVEGDGIVVSSVHPGPVDTQMQRDIQARLGNEYVPERYIRPESVAAAVRAVVDAGEDAQLTSVSVRPRAASR
ncbi:SDR family oxidoreductase [Kocuria sp. M4R2S49]|uniref:SDR family oxidoreductase n=1 Tax=Kocuria rhizosphaericola TaxID=3376284 RepID=UPI003793D80E